MNPEAETRQLGEYRLKQLLLQTPLCNTWLAEQISVSRRVLLDELRADQSDKVDLFLADVRAKAAIDHPLVSSVYEAVSEPGVCFYAYELLPGVTLKELYQQNQTLPPARLAYVLRRVSEAQLQYESLGQATSPLGLEDVYQDQQGVIRLNNLAIAGPRTPRHSAADIAHLALAMVPLVAVGQPGTSRLLTLFGWMRGEQVVSPLTWAQTRDTCMQIEHQLADSLSTIVAAKDDSGAARKSPILMICIAAAVLLLGIAFIALKMRPPAPVQNSRIPLPSPVTIAADNHKTPDNTQSPLPAFRISAHEITIGEYAEFLETINVLAKDNRQSAFDLADQPAEKKSHEPTDWPALLAAAKSQGLWQNQIVTLDSPVCGVDWWDASAYAVWKKARLPTQEEWFAALTCEHKLPANIPPALWAPVTAPTADTTPQGIIGLAGSVSEWTSTQAPDPTNPLGAAQWVISGGSYQKSGSNALTREWTADRNLRRADLGFRVVFEEL